MGYLMENINIVFKCDVSFRAFLTLQSDEGLNTQLGFNIFGDLIVFFFLCSTLYTVSNGPSGSSVSVAPVQ
jgi:hypothetical protein